MKIPNEMSVLFSKREEEDFVDDGGGEAGEGGRRDGLTCAGLGGVVVMERRGVGSVGLNRTRRRIRGEVGDTISK